MPSSDQLFIGGGVFLTTQNSKCQVVLANFSFLVGWVVGDILDYSKLKVSSSGQIFIFNGGGILGKINQNFGSLACSCIADSLSHTTCVGSHQTSSGSSGRVREWGKKREIYAATFGYLSMSYFYRPWGGAWPPRRPPAWIRYCIR